MIFGKVMKNVDQNLIQEMVRQFRTYPEVERVLLFGSRARGDHSERSDYDVAIYGTLSSEDKVKLRYTVNEELPTLHKIDMLFVEELKNIALINNIQKEGIAIYDKNKE